MLPVSNADFLPWSKSICVLERYLTIRTISMMFSYYNKVIIVDCVWNLLTASQTTYSIVLILIR